MTTSYYSVGPRNTTNQVSISQLEYRTILAGEKVTQYEVVFQDGSFVRQARGDNPNVMDGVGLVSTTVDSGVPSDVIIRGRITNTSWNWTSGSPLYVSATTSGGLTHTAPTASGHVIQKMGMALTTTVIELNPQRGMVIAE